MEILHQTRSFILFLFYEAFTIDYTVTCNSIHFISIVAFHSLTYTMYTIYKLVHVSTHTYPHTTSHTRQMLGIFYINNTIRFEIYLYIYTITCTYTYTNLQWKHKTVWQYKRYCLYLVSNAMTTLGKQRILMGNISSIDNSLITFKQLTGDQSCTFKIQPFPRQRENWQYPVISFVWPDVTSTSDNVELGMLPIHHLDRINRLPRQSQTFLQV